jgi:Bacterial regulatory helix-turn-helix protein, lysR family
MDLNQLEYFLRVAELGSINRAAKELGLSQPALSRSLSQLEQDLGQQLVVRCQTGITITEAGSILASRGLALLQIRERRLTAKVPLEPENPGLCLEFVRCKLVGQTVTLRSVLVERDTSGMHVAPIDTQELHWAFVVHRQRQQMAPVRRLATIIKSAIADAVRGGLWPGASIVG